MQTGPTPYILVIEDDEERRMGLLHDLLRRGHRVVSCCSVAEVDEVTRHPTHGMTMPELVIIGERLEREGGRALCRAFEQRFSRLGWITYRLDCDLEALDELLGALIEEGHISRPSQAFD